MSLGLPLRLVRNASDLRGLLERAAADEFAEGRLDLFFAEGTVLELGGAPIIVPGGVNASISSTGMGTTLDGRISSWMSR